MTINSHTNSTVNVSGVSVPEIPSISGMVLVCGDSAVAAGVVNMKAGPGKWQIRLIDGLCGNSDAIGDAVSTEQVNRLILALCRREYSKTEVQARSRRAGVETFGTQIIQIPSHADDHVNKAVAITSVRGAMARAEAFSGATPENVKTTFSGSGEKISRRALFTIPPIEYRPVPTIDKSVCIAGSGCTQCEKNCPHSALKNVAGVVKVDAAACNSCGICVAACPQRAVEFPGYSPVEIEHQVEAVLATQRETTKDIVFACSNSAELPSGDWQYVPVACAAMVPSSALLAVVAAGARSVGILRCVEECAQRSRETVDGRIDYAQNILERAGLNPNRVLDLPPSDSDQKMASPSISNPPERDPVSIDIFGRTAASNSILAISGRTDVSIEPFVHPYSPIAIPIINSSTCTMCGTCSAVCPTGALMQVNSGEWVELTLDAAKCMACNECVASCPEVSNGAIELEKRTDVNALTIGRVILNGDETVSCDNCDTVFTSALTLSKLESLLGDDYTYDTYGALCPECRTLN